MNNLDRHPLADSIFRRYIEGKLQTRKWQDQNGQDRYTTEVVANDMQMLGSRGDAPPRQQGEQGGFRSNKSAQQAPAPADSGGGSFDDDDIPF